MSMLNASGKMDAFGLELQESVRWWNGVDGGAGGGPVEFCFAGSKPLQQVSEPEMELLYSVLAK